MRVLTYSCSYQQLCCSYQRWYYSTVNLCELVLCPLALRSTRWQHKKMWAQKMACLALLEAAGSARQTSADRLKIPTLVPSSW